MDSHKLRSALSNFATGISVLTITDENSQVYGVTVNSFSSVSLDPPLVLWSLGEFTYSLDHFLNADNYIVNVLSADQQDISNNFSLQGEFDRFKKIPYVLSDKGLPFLDNCLARFHCRKFKLDRIGDHWLFISQVEEIEQSEGEPLIYFNSRYRLLCADN